jgi:hypothetical protein
MTLERSGRVRALGQMMGNSSDWFTSTCKLGTWPRVRVRCRRVEPGAGRHDTGCGGVGVVIAVAAGLAGCSAPAPAPPPPVVVPPPVVHPPTTMSPPTTTTLPPPVTTLPPARSYDCSISPKTKFEPVLYAGHKTISRASRRVHPQPLTATGGPRSRQRTSPGPASRAGSRQHPWDRSCTSASWIARGTSLLCPSRRPTSHGVASTSLTRHPTRDCSPSPRPPVASGSWSNLQRAPGTGR